MHISYYMETVPFLCLHCFMDGYNLSLSLSCSPSLSLWNLLLIGEICRSCIMEIVPFLSFHHITDGHSLSPSLYAICLSIGTICISHITGDSTSFCVCIVSWMDITLSLSLALPLCLYGISY